MSFEYDNIDTTTPYVQHIDFPKDWEVVMTVCVSMVFEHKFDAIRKLYPDTKPTEKYHSVVNAHYEIKFSTYATTFENLMKTIRQITQAVDIVLDIEIKCLTKHQIPTDVILKQLEGIFHATTILKIKNLEIGDFNFQDEGIDLYDQLPQLQFVNCCIHNVICNITWARHMRDGIKFPRTKILDGEYHYHFGYILKPGKALRSNSKYLNWKYIIELEKEYKAGRL